MQGILHVHTGDTAGIGHAPHEGVLVHLLSLRQVLLDLNEVLLRVTSDGRGVHGDAGHLLLYGHPLGIVVLAWVHVGW